MTTRSLPSDSTSPESEPKTSHCENDARPRSDGKRQAVERDACVICLEPISERAVAVPCNHCTFDFLCIASWLQDHATCPLCKTKLRAVQYDWRSPWDFKTYLVPISKAPNDSSANHRSQPPLHHQRPRPIRRRNASHLPANNARPTETAALFRRRHVYTRNMYSCHVGSNRASPHRDITPTAITSSPPLQRRARMFIRRELGVFSFLTPSIEPAGDTTPAIETMQQCSVSRRVSNVEFLLEYIISVLKTVEIKSSSGKAEEMLGEFLGDENARLFLHELAAWLRSPYEDLEAWDRFVQYKERLPRSQCDGGAAESAGKSGRTPADRCRGVG